ncbi:MAG TPA: hypothetical protein VN081_06875 [Dongiaceae bacterium]|nr:hypothetical protein [Dongiaceae bacterium]
MQITSPIYHSFASVTPSDTTLVNCRAIYIGGAGDIALSIDGSTTAVTIKAPPVGTILPIELNGGRIMSTNTTATNIVALS